MAYRNDWVRLIRQLAQKYGVDPQAALAVASREGLSGGRGDQGTSAGPFQLHRGGALPANQSYDWAESPAGIDYALRQIGGVARGLHGSQAVNAIVSKFERPADPQGEISGAIQALGQFGGAVASEGPRRLSLPSQGAAAPAPESSLAQQWASGNLDWQAIGSMLKQRRQSAQPLAGGKSTAGTPQTPGAADPPSGYPQMLPHGGPVAGAPRLLSAPQADTGHVDTRILTTLAAFGKAIGKPVTIISGYRSPGYSAKVGGYSTDPHTRGVAVDAYINGVPIGNYPGAYKWLTAHGLESGAQPGFYHGKPDPEHVQIPGSGVNKSIHARRTR